LTGPTDDSARFSPAPSQGPSEDLDSCARSPLAVRREADDGGRAPIGSTVGAEVAVGIEIVGPVVVVAAEERCPFLVKRVPVGSGVTDPVSMDLEARPLDQLGDRLERPGKQASRAFVLPSATSSEVSSSASRAPRSRMSRMASPAIVGPRLGIASTLRAVRARARVPGHEQASLPGSGAGRAWPPSAHRGAPRAQRYWHPRPRGAGRSLGLSTFKRISKAGGGAPPILSRQDYPALTWGSTPTRSRPLPVGVRPPGSA